MGSNDEEEYNIFRLNAETWTKRHVSKHLESPCSDEPGVNISGEGGVVGRIWHLLEHHSESGKPGQPAGS